MQVGIERFQRIWPAAVRLDGPNPRPNVAYLEGLVEALHELLELFRSRPPDTLAPVPVGKRVELTLSHEREKWLALIRAEMTRWHLEQVRQPLDSWRVTLSQALLSGKAHLCLRQMAEALEERDVGKWKAAWEMREHLRVERERLRRYEELLSQLDEVHPDLAKLLRANQGKPDWTDRLIKIEQAWAWAAARAWLRKITNPERCAWLAEERHQLQQRIEKKLEELAVLRAWQVFFARLDERTEQSLTAWKQTLARIGKGTGEYAPRNRRIARQYLMACIPKIPAWIMPLHRLWETTDPKPGVFDTVIVDEVSQAGIEALVLLLLARRIIVVGDDKQNSPEAVGVREDDTAQSCPRPSQAASIPCPISARYEPL